MQINEKFAARRAVERLRDGLFDPFAVNRLTVEKDRLETLFSNGLKALEKGKASPLGICGSYGQGKSHTLSYLNQLALAQGYATSVVSLDLREIPFHQFSIVYRALMERLSLPDLPQPTLPGNVGKKFTEVWKNKAGKDALERFSQVLETMPHRFKVTLTAMLSKTRRLTPKESTLKKHQAYRPKEFGYWLDKALMGHDLPIKSLKSICNYREVEGYRDHSLICRGNDPYFQMIQSLGKLLNEMGYKGLVLFFDEAESITQGRLTHRKKSYHLLDQFFQAHGSVFPLFAFTDDFFEKVNHELYDTASEETVDKTFPKNYAEAWQDLAIYRLSDFSSQGWDFLLDHLTQLYSEAYQIELPSQIKLSLKPLLKKFEDQETRFKLKALVNKLDVLTATP